MGILFYIFLGISVSGLWLFGEMVLWPFVNSLKLSPLAIVYVFSLKFY